MTSSSGTHSRDREYSGMVILPMALSPRTSNQKSPQIEIPYSLLREREKNLSQRPGGSPDVFTGDEKRAKSHLVPTGKRLTYGRQRAPSSPQTRIVLRISVPFSTSMILTSMLFL